MASSNCAISSVAVPVLAAKLLNALSAVSPKLPRYPMHSFNDEASAVRVLLINPAIAPFAIVKPSPTSSAASSTWLNLFLLSSSSPLSLSISLFSSFAARLDLPCSSVVLRYSSRSSASLSSWSDMVRRNLSAAEIASSFASAISLSACFCLSNSDRFLLSAVVSLLIFVRKSTACLLVGSIPSAINLSYSDVSA